MIFLTCFFLILIGWILGSTVNYLSDVLPTKRRLCWPFCHSCDEKQALFNYFLWPRRCERCGSKRGTRTWLVELAGIGLTLWIWFSTPSRLGFLPSLVLLTYFGLVVVIDLEHRLILHMVSLAGAGLGLVIGVWMHGWQSTLMGGFAGFIIMLGLYILGAGLVRLMNSRSGKKVEEEALGFGDVNLGGILGLILGWPGIVAGIILAILIGGAISLIYLLVMAILRRYQSFSAIPYGPFLIAAAFILIFLRDIVLKVV